MKVRFLRFFFPFGAAIALVIAMLVFVLPGPAPTAAAPTFTVNSPTDATDANPGDGSCDTGGGVCTLRAAIMEANHTPGGGTTIHFGLPGVVTYLLAIPMSGTDDEATGDLNITQSMTIIGNGAEKTIIDGNGGALGDHVIEITGTVSIIGVTIQHGYSTYWGGGILDNGALTLVNSAIINNTADGPQNSGGGIYSAGPVTLTNSTLSGNTSGEFGGGIYSINGLSIIDSTVSGNSTGSIGGGIGTEAKPSIIMGSTISGNTALSGGGIFKNGSILNIINSTISGNHSNGNGGGIYNNSETMSLYNVTVEQNLANADATDAGDGGGVFNRSGTVNFENSIIAQNQNIVIIDGIPQLNFEDCAGTIDSLGDNLMYETSGCMVNGPIIIADPLLGPLAGNGGPTLTYALLPGSPAIDTGNPIGCTDNLGAFLTRDQRGYPRPGFRGGALRCDLGAFEYSFPSLFLPLIVR